MRKINLSCYKYFLLLPAFLGTYGFCYLLGLAGMEQAYFSVLSVLVLGALFVLLDKTRERLEKIENNKLRRRRIYYSALVSFVFSVTMIMGWQLQTGEMTEPGVAGKGRILLRGACLAIAVFPFWNALFGWIGKLGYSTKVQEPEKHWKPWRVFGISALVIFACLIPVWLAYYPIVMSYDFHRQVNEAARGFAWFMPYQPLIHTWLIWVFLQLGYLLQDLEAGMAGLALLHMLCYSLATAYGTAFLYRCVRRKAPVVAAVLFFGLFPLNTVMVVCTTKDVLFSVLFLVFVLLLAERFFFARDKKRLVLDVLLVLEGILLLQFRNNAIYAMAVFGVFWVLFTKGRERWRVLLICALLVAGGKGCGVLIKEALGTVHGIPKVEMVSVPVQQFARVAYRQGANLDSETHALLDYYFPEESWDVYNPSISDGAKASVGGILQEAWLDDLSGTVRDWARLGLQYPNEYIDAVLELTRGYWFLDDRSYAENLGVGLEGRMGVIFTYNSSAMDDFPGIAHESKFPWLEERLEEIVSGNSFYKWPVVSLLCKSAFYVWWLVLLVLAFLYRGQKPQALLCLFLLLYLGTLLLGPVAWLRYVFPFMLTLPGLTGLLFIREEW